MINNFRVLQVFCHRFFLKFMFFLTVLNGENIACSFAAQFILLSFVVISQMQPTCNIEHNNANRETHIINSVTSYAANPTD